ncbi:unnamed protein product [Macrosiphum euphorbiae]|uniref:Ycf15 n=1 Tax=Macrosiphum euphorbiae TaxID=13131 RepID=A0AAV0XV15_9HEMI|nr:unnamed protein product [Macrosiphum euphorbiae]
MVFDTDKFISCIQSNPYIWEMGSKEYMDKFIKQKSWLNIGETMYPDWTEQPESEKENKGKQNSIMLYFTFLP